jgi:glutathione S-transferase
MKLYYSSGACSLSPHIVLREAGIAFQLVRVDTKTHKLDDGTDFYQINGKGYVPVLELDDGERITEGPAIVQYLADLAPNSRLAPKNGTIERTRLQEWLNFISTELHKQFSPLFSSSTPEEWKKALHQKLATRFDWLSTQLKGKAYLTGSQFTVADAYLFAVVNWTNFTGIDLQRWPVLADYVARVAARPKVQEALKAEGLLKDRAA